MKCTGSGRKAKIVLRVLLCGCLSAYQETFWSVFFLVFALNRDLKGVEPRQNQITPILQVCFVKF